jgi:TolA-binding protein
MFLALLLGGAGAAAWWIKHETATRATTGSTASTEPGPGSNGDTTPETAMLPGDDPGSGARAEPGSAGASHDSPSATVGTAGSGSSADPVGEGRAPGLDTNQSPTGTSAVLIDGGAASADGATEVAVSGSEAEAEVDPAAAEDPAPASTKPSDETDEAPNAPTTTEEVEKRAPAAPVRATTLPGAVQLIKSGKRDLALASLRALWKKTPNSAYIPFLLGNLYFDQRWWLVALDHYTSAIKKNAAYRANPTMNRNVIRMLASKKTSRRAEGFLKYTVGKPALPYLKYAAQHDTNNQVKRLSGWLAKHI